jgi:signal transduction histidine kinase
MSLRRRLVISICAAILMVGVAGALVAYFQVSHQTRRLLDGQLRQVAAVVASRAILQRHRDDALQVEVWNLDGSRRYTSNPTWQLTHRMPLGFSQAEINGEPYRIFTADFPDRSVAVAQAVDARDDQAEGAALAALTPALLMLPVLALVMAAVVSVLLRPVREAAREVAELQPLSSGPLTLSGLPREIAPLVEEINRLLQRQHAALKEESAFLTDAAHALRTPLAALQLQVDVLDGSPDPVERKSRLAALRAGVERATRLSEQLLAVAPAPASGASALDCVDFDAILQETCDLYRAISADAHVELRLQAESGVSLHCNPRDLVVIFGNLIDNAIHFSPSGSVIEIESRNDGATAFAEVRDCGPGIATTDPINTSPRAGGIERLGGFGLRAVQNVTARLGGEVRMLSRAGHASGLVVRITLPIV